MPDMSNVRRDESVLIAGKSALAAAAALISPGMPSPSTFTPSLLVCASDRCVRCNMRSSSGAMCAQPTACPQRVHVMAVPVMASVSKRDRPPRPLMQSRSSAAVWRSLCRLLTHVKLRSCLSC